MFYSLHDQYDIQTEGKGFVTDFQAMLDWFELWNLKPCDSKYFGEEINSILVKRWIDYRDSLSNTEGFNRPYLEKCAKQMCDPEDLNDFLENLGTTSDGHLMALGRIFCSCPMIQASTHDGIAIHWSIEDVKHICPRVSDDQARKVLHYLKDNHNAEVGINWDVIDSAIETILPDVVDSIDERYAEDIIDGKPHLYDAIEIHGIRNANNTDDADGTCFEVDDENPEQFSLYLHIVSGGVECVGDFSTRELANQYADELSKRFEWKVHDFSQPIDPEIQRQLRGFTPDQFVKVDWDLLGSVEAQASCSGEIAVIFNDNYSSIKDAVVDGAVYFASQPICNRYELEGALLGCEATRNAIGANATLYFASHDQLRKSNS